ncbi:alpha-tubulin acetylase isoform X2 [Haematobia irritans]|uniref:alpha-tubulin acetylase isoform X2 n=1 Tax=Haematobia irritans TaxID=7368 RepID=UPI003F4F5E37
MVEFRFDISPLFTQPIVKVTSNLLPHTFRGDRRQCLDATSKMSEIIDRLGQLSANAQKLNTPVTTAQRLRMSENQTIYLMADVNAGNNGAVIGLLKVGTKDLYLFDETGQARKVENAPCILDFYIHESRQRAGLGKDLFETMLADEKWTPVKCSVDRPSEKLLGFLKKHYGLVRSIPQANNFVLYEGFFDDGKASATRAQQTNGSGNGMYITNSPNTQLFGATYLGDDNHKRRTPRQLDAASNMAAQITTISPGGRYGARRPTCSMAEIIHSGTTPKGAESGSVQHQKVDFVVENFENLQVQDNNNETADQPEPELQNTNDIEDDLQTQPDIDEPEAPNDIEISTTNTMEHGTEQEMSNNSHQDSSFVQSPSQPTSKTSPSLIGSDSHRPAPTFHLSKQHTGMKNRSYGVGMAVTPTSKMEFDQESREDFGIVKINRPVGKCGGISPSASHPGDDVMSTVSSGEGLTDQGYNDLKFYHNKLW